MKLNVGFLFLVFFLLVTCASFEAQTNERGAKKMAEVQNDKGQIMYMVKKH